MKNILIATIAAATIGLTGSAALAAQDLDRDTQYQFLQQSTEYRAPAGRYYTSGQTDRDRAIENSTLSDNARDQLIRERARDYR